MSWTEIYQSRGVEREELEQAVREIVDELKADTALRKRAISLGLAVDEAVALARHLRIEQGGSGLSPELTDIIVKCVGAAAGALSAQVIKDLWTLLIFPRLKSRFGEDSLERRTAPTSSSDEPCVDAVPRPS